MKATGIQYKPQAIDGVYSHGTYFKNGVAYKVNEAIEKFGFEAEKIIMKSSWDYLLNKKNERDNNKC